MKKIGLFGRKIAAAICILFFAATAFAVVLTAPRSTYAEAEVSVWDGNLAAAGWNGDDPGADNVEGYSRVDTEGNKTVSISSAQALAYFAYQSNKAENNGFKDYTVSLECDIDLGGSSKIWIPIGFASRKTDVSSHVAFYGTFDGKGHTVSNLDTAAFYKNLHTETENGLSTAAMA